MTDNTNTQAYSQQAEPNPDMKSLNKLVGTWKISGGAEGQTTYEWMPGGFFLLQHVDMVHSGHHINGLEVIGHLKLFGEEPSPDIKTRFYDSMGDTLDYVSEIQGNTFMIWAGEKGSPAFYKGTFSEDGNTCTGSWVFPGGGGYDTTMTRIKSE